MQGIRLENNRAFMTTRPSNRLDQPLGIEDEGHYILEMNFAAGNVQSINTAICVYKYRTGYLWQPLEKLTHKQWREHREKIGSYLQTLSQEAIMRFLKSENSRNAEEVNRHILLDLFNRLSENEKKDMLLKHRNSTFTKHTCIKCFAIAHNKHKCIHPTCPGLCTNCFENWDDEEKCLACGAEQHVECPICQEEKVPNELFKLNCNHSVCWKCFGTSVVSGHMLKKCPMCRKNIVI